MKLTTKTALLALSLTAMPFAAARAAEHISIDFGTIAFGYTDGYWDRDHHWHRWHHHRDWERYREERREHAYEYRHTHDRDRGWHDHDRYWDHH
jgi:hypothetical protein